MDTHNPNQTEEENRRKLWDSLPEDNKHGNFWENPGDVSDIIRANTLYASGETTDLINIYRIWRLAFAMCDTDIHPQIWLDTPLVRDIQIKYPTIISSIRVFAWG